MAPASFSSRIVLKSLSDLLWGVPVMAGMSDVYVDGVLAHIHSQVVVLLPKLTKRGTLSLQEQNPKVFPPTCWVHDFALPDVSCDPWD